MKKEGRRKRVEKEREKVWRVRREKESSEGEGKRKEENWWQIGENWGDENSRGERKRGILFVEFLSI